MEGLLLMGLTPSSYSVVSIQWSLHFLKQCPVVSMNFENMAQRANGMHCAVRCVQRDSIKIVHGTLINQGICISACLLCIGSINTLDYMIIRKCIL